MNSTNSDPHDDEHRAMREALERDAARMKEELFDPGLHYATMRRIRALDGGNRALRGWQIAAWGAACVMLLALVVRFAPWRSSQPVVAVTGDRVAPGIVEPGRASAWSYHQVSREGDEALLAMLDRDALVLLPPTASPFSHPLN